MQKNKRIVTSQALLQFGILTHYKNGDIELLPYKVDRNGNEYAELFPNEDIED
jgi:hypothetical protein